MYMLWNKFIFSPFVSTMTDYLIVFLIHLLHFSLDRKTIETVGNSTFKLANLVNFNVKSCLETKI